MEPFVTVLEWMLRAFGVFWIIGGILTFKEARSSQLMDHVLDALTPEEPEDPLVTRYLYVSSVLTTLSGVAMAAASPWAAVIVGILVLAQLSYFFLQNRRYARAGDDEAREDATVSVQAKNAFKVSLMVWVMSIFLFAL